MPNTSSAIRRVRLEAKRRSRNRVIKSGTRTALKKALDAIESGDKEAATAAVREATSSLDRAAQKGIMPANAVARQKSRLAKHLKAI